MAYDPSTTAGFVRLLIADTVEASYLFTDAEITAFLTNGGNSPHLAAAMAIRSLCSDKAKLSKRIERQSGYKSEQHAIDDLLKLADQLEEQASTASGIQTGTLDSGDTVFDYSRPGWRDVGTNEQGL